MKILYVILISSHGLIGMAGIKEFKISCKSESEFISQSLACDQDEETPSKTVMISLDESNMSFCMIRPNEKDTIEEETPDVSEGSTSLDLSEASDDTQTSSALENIMSTGLLSLLDKKDTDIERAIEKFKSLLSEWKEPGVGDYVAVIIGEEFKRYGKVIEKNDEGYYTIDQGRKDQSLLYLKEHRLVLLSDAVNSIAYINNNLGQLLDNNDLAKLPAIVRPHVYKHGIESKQEQRKKFANRVVEKTERRGSSVLVALNKNIVVEGIVQDIKFALNVLKKEQVQHEPDYTGSIYSIVYTNPVTNEEELGHFTIYRIRMKSDLLNEESYEI
jgi:hypothetical protein